MNLFRLAHTRYMHDDSGEGAKKWGGRWNPPGTACVYTSTHLSLAMLEKLAHALDFKDIKDAALIEFKVVNAEKIYSIDPLKLKPGWEHDVAYTQWMGRQILENGAYIGFTAPSIIVPGEQNVILLPNLTESGKVVLLNAGKFIFDKRLTRFLPD